MAGTPSVMNGFRLAARLHRLVALVWLVSLAVLTPAQLVVLAMTGQTRANRPSGGYGAGEDLVIFFEIIRPVVAPLAVALGFGCLCFLAWWALWHAGIVRWHMRTDGPETGVAGIIGDGVSVWWRYARLAFIAGLAEGSVLAICWLPTRADLGAGVVPIFLVAGALWVVAATALVWIAVLRGAWLLGEPGRHSALVAWVRGLSAVLRQPLGSLLPLLVWSLPGIVLLVLPLLYEGPAAGVFLLIAWLLSAFCWVALHLSFAPPKPPPARPVTPLDPPGPYVTTRFPTLLRDE